MKAIHRNNDLRACNAKTVVVGQSTVFCNGELVSVDGDINTDGSGELIGSSNVFINRLSVIVDGDTALPDDLCQSIGNEHCLPLAVSGSNNVFVNT